MHRRIYIYNTLDCVPTRHNESTVCVRIFAIRSPHVECGSSDRANRSAIAGSPKLRRRFVVQFTIRMMSDRAGHWRMFKQNARGRVLFVYAS